MDILVETELRMPMRDGVELVADVYRPRQQGQWPTLVQRLPYNRELPALRNVSIDVLRTVQSGYAVINQDTRGRYAASGTFHPFFDEARDGADTIAWAARQPWSSGKIGMVGGSYFGATQWLAATQAPDALLAIAPFITAADYHEGWAYQGGAFELGFNLYWTITSLGLGEILRRMQAGRAGPFDFAQLVRAADNIDTLYWRLPLVDQPILQGLAPYYFDWLEHPDYDDYWRSIAPKERYADIIAPALNIGGWYDLFVGGTLANYRGMKQRGGNEASRRPHLIIGPWAHGDLLGMFPERHYGLLAGTDGFDLTAHQLRWFDHWLKGIDNGVLTDAPVQLFIMGSNVWRSENDWPLPDTAFTPYYLHSGGRANTAGGDGSLSTAPPGDAEVEDIYLYDPRDPVPTVGGATFLPGLQVGANGGPRDQRVVEKRHDVLIYTTPALDRDLEVTGPVELVLFASSSARDTDFTGKLVDVHPNGRAEILTDGILRARYRDSLSAPTPLEDGQIYELHLDLWATANLFYAGHRVRLEVSSSNFPRFDRNTNTGNTIAADTPQDLVQAVNRVYHDRAHPSHLILPIIDRR
jgi:putative CocE/NonD family hydrolase